MLGLNPKNHIQVQKEKVYFVVACLLPPYNVKKGMFMSHLCNYGKEITKNREACVESLF